MPCPTKRHDNTQLFRRSASLVVKCNHLPVSCRCLSWQSRAWDFRSEVPSPSFSPLSSFVLSCSPSSPSFFRCCSSPLLFLSPSLPPELVGYRSGLQPKAPTTPCPTWLTYSTSYQCNGLLIGSLKKKYKVRVEMRRPTMTSRPNLVVKRFECILSFYVI
jgi:hypothetical protein